jgi:hypothetical protein
MGQLYDAKVKVEQVIEQKKLDAVQIKGKLSLKSGLLFAIIRPNTPDDPVKLEKLRAAVRELLGVDL